jgi:hypothetical protein
MAGRIAYYGGIVTNGLVLALDAAKRDSYPGTGTVWNDISGFQNNGTLTNGPTYSSSDLGNIVLDGTNDYIKTDYSVNNVYFSIELIVKPNSVSGTRVYVGKFSGGGADWWIGGNNTTLTYSTSGQQITHGTALSTSNFYIINAIMGVSGKELYVNGTLVSSAAYQNIAPAGGVVIGAFGDGLGFYSSINVYGFKLYNKGLTAAEVTQNFNAQRSRYRL